MDYADSTPTQQRLASTLWKKGLTKIKTIMAMQGTWGKNRSRSIFGNQFGKQNILEDMPEIYLDRIEKKDEDNNSEIGLEDLTARTEKSSVVGWDNDDSESASFTADNDGSGDSSLPHTLKGKGYKTNVRRSIHKLKNAAKKVKKFLTIVRLAHDPTRRTQLTYNEVVSKLRDHYDPDGYHAQAGDSQHEYYTDLGLLKRESLKHHPQIRSLLDLLWEASDKDSSGGLDKEEYMIMCKKVYKAIVDDSDDPEDEAERNRIAEEDWIADSQGHDILDYRRFTTAWFQLADHWTHDLSVEAYCRFLGEIKDTVAHMVNGRMVWKKDADIHHMEVQNDGHGVDEDYLGHVHKPVEKEEIVVKVEIKKKIVPKAKLVSRQSNLTKRKKKEETTAGGQIASMVLMEGNPNDKTRNVARIHSRNGLYTGSTVPPPKGWDAKKTNEWGLTFTRIPMRNQVRKMEEAASSLGVRASASSPPRTRPSTSPAIGRTGQFTPNASSASSAFGSGLLQDSSDQQFQQQQANREEEQQQQQQQYYPSSSGGFQSAKFRYPQPYDAIVGSTGAGGGFEWSQPNKESASRVLESNGSELLRPSWVQETKQRPSTSSGRIRVLSSSSSLHGRLSDNDISSVFRSPWNDQIARPSTASSAYLPSQATLTLVPTDTFVHMLNDSVVLQQQNLNGGGSSLLLKSTATTGSMMLDYIQSPAAKKKKKSKKKIKDSSSNRPKTAPGGKPRAHQFDRHATRHNHGSNRSRSPSGKKSRKQRGNRSKSPPKLSGSTRRRPKSRDDEAADGGGITRMRKRAGPSQVLSSPAEIPAPLSTIDPVVVRPMTTGAIRRKRRSSPLRSVSRVEGGNLFRCSTPSSSSSTFATTVFESSIISSSGTDRSGVFSNGEGDGGSRILDLSDLRGLPTSARTLMNQYSGYDPLASLNEASMGIVGGGGSSGLFHEVGSRKRRGREQRSQSRSRRSLGGSSMSMSMSAYMNKLVLPASQRTIRLVKLREDCTTEDVVGVMLAVGVHIAPIDVTLSDVSSRTRKRQAKVRFAKYTEYKLALRMLKICNRTEQQSRLATGSAGSDSKADNNNQNVKVTSLWDGKDLSVDPFGPTRLSPISKVHIPKSLKSMYSVHSGCM